MTVTTMTPRRSRARASSPIRASVSAAPANLGLVATSAPLGRAAVVARSAHSASPVASANECSAETAALDPAGTALSVRSRAWRRA